MNDSPLSNGITSALNFSAVEHICAGEPDWLRKRREHAWTLYEQTPMPTTKLEEWRYTDLRKKLQLDALSLSQATLTPDDPKAWPKRLRKAMEEDRQASGHIVVIDGHVVHSDLEPDFVAKGVILSSLHDAIKQYPDLVGNCLATEAVPPEEGKFAALNAALWSDGIFLYVPAEVQLNKPIRVTRWLSEAGIAQFGRVLILAEDASRISYVDEILSDDFSEQTLASNAVEIIAKEGAQVQYVSVQRLGRGAFYQSVQRTLAHRNATLDTLNVALGA